MLPGWCCIANRHIGARERRQLIPHVRFQVPFLGSESQLKSGFACAGLFNFYPAPNVNLGIDREGTAKSQDGQQKGTLAHVKRKVATALSMKVKPV